ncbi:hypothetical protein [Leucothrix pacifica]|uniref:Uncharacterized protein n=1 Tax=Leucothrix pacifica TaxID=1247513 RepID=A0A317C8U8_9GAMM|nr:hypothetical protein [Leucothrix pacifica]PWQ92750.1 hypothetical protein DKW60_19260 [Leucothrix pacifica]
MLRFLPGVLLLQLATLGICLFIPQPIEGKAWIAVLLPIVLLGIFVALWFGSVAKNSTQEAVNKTKLAFAKERENIHVKAEKAKSKLIDKTHKQIASESRKTHRGANLKVGLAFAATVGAGILMLVIELLTFGLMTITTAGGALGGYLVRAKKAHRELEALANQSAPLIEVSDIKPDSQSDDTSTADTPIIPSKGFKLPKPSILKRLP